jgi:hypothetical protein
VVGNAVVWSQRAQFLGNLHREEKNQMALPFKKGNVVKYETGYVANVMNVLDDALILDQDNAGNSGMFRVAVDPNNVEAAGLKVIR